MNEEHVVVKLETYNEFLRQKDRFEKEKSRLEKTTTINNVLACYYKAASLYNSMASDRILSTEEEIIKDLEKDYNVKITVERHVDLQYKILIKEL